MKRQAGNQTYRVIDANLNRAKEGLRVCEDIVRFVFDNKYATYRFRKIRHSLDYICDNLDYKALLKHRNADRDVGRACLETRTRLSAKPRAGAVKQKQVLRINIQRVKESLRVLEEFLKFIDEKLASRAKDARYNTYSLEKALFEKL